MKETDNLEHELEQAIRGLPVEVAPAVDQRILADMVAASARLRPIRLMHSTILLKATLLMKRKFLRFAAVAAVLLAACISFSWLQSGGRPAGAAFGAVADQIERARGAKYRQTMEIEGLDGPHSSEHTFVEPGYVHMTAKQGDSETVTVLDFIHGQELWLFPQGKHAVHVQRVGDRRYMRLLTGFKWLYPLQHGGRFLRQEKQDGRLLNVFGLYQPLRRITVWADSQTNLPVRVEEVELPGINADPTRPIPGLDLRPEDFGVQPSQPAADSRPVLATQSATSGTSMVTAVVGHVDRKVTRTLSDFEWDPQVDPSLFSTVPPAGYNVREERIPSPVSGEQALVDSLWFWAEMSNGSFPATIDELARPRELLLRKYRKGISPRQEYEEAANQGYSIMMGVAYAQALDVDGNWHYAGSQVKFGQADQLLCWWREESASSVPANPLVETYRVIYGDLSSRDVPADQMPETVRTPGAASNGAARAAH